MKKLFSMLAILGTLLIPSTVANAYSGYTTLYAWASPTPAANTISTGQEDVEVFNFNLYPRGAENVVLDSLSFVYRSNTAGKNAIDNVTLYDPSTNDVLGVSYIVNSKVSFNNTDFVLTKNTVKTLGLKVDVNDDSSVDGGKFMFYLTDAESKGLETANNVTFKKTSTYVNSGIFTVDASCYDIAAFKSATSPTTTNVAPGEVVDVFDFQFANSGCADAAIKKLEINYEDSGLSAEPSLALYDKETGEVISTVLPYDGKATFNLSDPVIVAKDDYKKLGVKAQFPAISPYELGTGSFVLSLSSVKAVDTLSGEVFYPDTDGVASNVMLVGMY